MCLLTDIAISGDRNVMIKKETEESLKHKDLTTDVQYMWNVISDASNNRVILNHLSIIQRILNEISGKRGFKKVQKTATLVTPCILGKVQM
jgi:hypothetical protein